MTASPKTILWIEDRPETVSWEEHKLKENGYRIVFRYLPHDIRNFLIQHHEEVVAIIVDIMLHGVPNVNGVSTEYGLEAGWILVEHFLRKDGSPYQDIPILILSTKEKNENEGDQHHLTRLCSKGGGTIQYIQKRGMNARRDFMQWLKTL